MPRTNLDEVSKKISMIAWSNVRQGRHSQLELLREYMRRSALWSHSLQVGGWPFFDIAGGVNPEIRAPEEVVEEVLGGLPDFSTYHVLKTVEWILHFSVLKDSGEVLPGLPDPYAPLLLVYERGDMINVDGTGFIEIDGMAMKRGGRQRFIEMDPVIERFDLDYLSLIDRNMGQH